MIEWPEGDAEPDHYWLITLPGDIGFERMVDLTKLRWRIERDYLELKQEVGLGHDEGPGWRGFHHHASLCIAAYRFLISETETIPPSGPSRARCGTHSGVPRAYRPRAYRPRAYRNRGSPSALAAAHAELDRDIAYPARAQPAQGTASLPMLRTISAETQTTG